MPPFKKRTPHSWLPPPSFLGGLGGRGGEGGVQLCQTFLCLENIFCPYSYCQIRGEREGSNCATVFPWPQKANSRLLYQKSLWSIRSPLNKKNWGIWYFCKINQIFKKTSSKIQQCIVMMWWFQISKHCQTPYKESEKNTSVLLFLLSSLVLSATHCLITDKQIFFLERPGKGLEQETYLNKQTNQPWL